MVVEFGRNCCLKYQEQLISGEWKWWTGSGLTIRQLGAWASSACNSMVLVTSRNGGCQRKRKDEEKERKREGEGVTRGRERGVWYDWPTLKEEEIVRKREKWIR